MRPCGSNTSGTGTGGGATGASAGGGAGGAGVEGSLDPVRVEIRPVVAGDDELTGVNPWAISFPQGIAWGLMGAAIGFAVSLFVTSWLCDSLGAKRMFLWFSWLAAGAALAFAVFARSFETAIWLFGLVGVTQGGCYTPAIMLVAQELPPSRRGAGVGWMLAGMSAGYVGSISLANALIATVDYQTAFVVCAVGTVAGAGFGALAAARVENRIAEAAPSRAAWTALFRDRRSLLLTIGYTGHCWELFGMWGWVPAFLIASLGGRFALGAVGLGVAIAIKALLHDDLAQGRLVQPFPHTRRTSRPMYLLYPEARAENPRLAAFRDWIVSEAAGGLAK